MGSGVRINVPNVELCIPQNKAIPKCPEFTVFDFANARRPPKNQKKLEPNEAMFLTITVNKKKEICAKAKKAGTYFPIMRKEFKDKAAMDAVKCEGKCFGSSDRGTKKPDKKKVVKEAESFA